MKPYRKRFNILYYLIICLVLLGPSISAAQTRTSPGAMEGSHKRPPVSRAEKKPERFVTIDFNNVDISVFIKFISDLTGKNFIIDRRVKGKVTIISPTKISVRETYKVFESVLEVHGYTAVESGEVIKIIPAPDARTKNIEIKLREEADSPEDKIVTQLIPLRYADPNMIKRLFAPLVSKSSVVLAYPPTNMLIVTDVYSNIKRLIQILKAIDITGIGREISVIPLIYSDAAKMVKLLKTVFKPAKRPKKGSPEESVSMVADERTNTIILLASKDDTEKINDLIHLLDKEIPRGKENIHVYYLEHATAEDLVKVLQELPQKQGAASKGKKTAPVISEKVKITADKATNSLIIMAEKDDYLVIEDVIKKLDIPRQMVYIESLIMEVDTEGDFELGTEWSAAGQVNYGDTPGVVAGGFSGVDPGYSNLGGLSQGALPKGFSLGTFAGAIIIDKVAFANIAAVIQAYKKDKYVHILATPQILTTDNAEAKIYVGKNVAYQTRAAVSSDNVADTYSSYEYRDVGITLKITPQISKDRMVRLIISQEITKLDELATVDTARPATLKRTIDTTVIVKDGHTVVIGGLIDDALSETEYRVPCLGDIPLLGWAFRSVSSSTEKTNLYVFLTPWVLESPSEAKALYKRKKEEIDKAKEEQSRKIEGGHIRLYK